MISNAQSAAWLEELVDSTHLTEEELAASIRAQFGTDFGAAQNTDDRLQSLQQAAANLEWAQGAARHWAKRASRFAAVLNMLQFEAIEMIQAAPDEQWRGKLGELKVVRNQPSVVIENDFKLPDEYCRISYEPNRTLIKQTILGGTEVPGARLERKASLRGWKIRQERGDE